MSDGKAGLAAFLWVGLGGGAGSVLRYLVASWGQRVAEALGWTFPLGTLTVNVLGSLAIGALAALLAQPGLISDTQRLALTVGVLGGFTTFSAYSYETMLLIHERQYGIALLNAGLNNILGLAAALLAFEAVRRWSAAATL